MSVHGFLSNEESIAHGNLKGVGGGASGILSGVAAVATVVAAIVGILSQFDLITSQDTPKTVAGSPILGPTLVTKPTVAPVLAPVAAAPAAKPSLVARAVSPHLHERRRVKPPPVEVALAEPTASHLGAEDRNLSHLENPEPRPPLPLSITIHRKASLARGATKEWGPAT